MPARNSIKEYLENGYYHVYNRGVEKRLTFMDAQDYAVFISYLKDYLLPKDEVGLRRILLDKNSSYKDKDKAIKLLRLNNFADKITLLAYCLMPNHFHLFFKQSDPRMIQKFIQSLTTRYTMYFNRKYKRVGSLFQAVYKAAQVIHDEQFIYLTKYIHSQALVSQNQPSSYPEYLGLRKTEWVKPQEVLNYFSKTNPLLTYKSFVENKEDDFSILREAYIDD